MPVPKKVKICFLAVFILHVMVAAPAAPAQRPLLLTVAGTTSEARQAVAAAGGVVVQELRTCLLVTAPTAALSRLRSSGARPEVIAAPAAGESFFLLHTELPSSLPVPQAGMRCRQLEEGLWLLQTTDAAFRSRLTQPYRLKALQLGETFPGPLDPAAFPPIASTETAVAGERSAETIPRLVAEVASERLRADIQALQDFKTRYASTPQCDAAGEFILERFRQLGLDALAESFTFETRYQSRNILAVIPGSVAPERMVLACAHYDSTSNNRLVSAPGADDNASGTAAVLELARILAGEKFDFSIGLLCVSAEEWGLYGSAYYARRARQQGAGIVAVVNLDMIAYPGGQQQVLDVIGNRQSEWLADRFIASGQPYVGLRLAKVINPSLTWSDHSSFWDQGFSALCGIEDSENPNYHYPGDTVDTLDLGFAAEVVKASLATVAGLAQPRNTPAAPTGLRARSQISAALFTSRKSVYLEWDANREALAGYQVYRAVHSHGPYQRLTTQTSARTSFSDLLLLPDQAYYYVVSAVDEQGRESNYSAEVRDDENN
jgi:hypothetical protein